MKRINTLARIVVTVLAVFVLVFGSAGNSAASPAPASQEKAGGIRMGYHPQTGMLSFVGASPESPIALKGAVGEGILPTARAGAILEVYAPQFGVANPSDELALKSERTDGERQIVRYQQVYQGVPILGGELVLNMSNGGLVSMNGEVSPNLSVPTVPVFGAEQARQRAIELTAKYYELKPSQLTATDPELWIYDPRLIGDEAPLPAHLVWRMDVKAEGRPIRELFLIDAIGGRVSLHFNQIDTAWKTGSAGGSGESEMSAAPASVQPVPPAVLGTPSLATYNANSTSSLPGSLLCSNNSRTCGSGNTDGNLAHAYAYDTYMAYSNLHGRDSIDGAGMAIISTVDYCPNPSSCPYQNAFWNSAQMVYGDGFAAADDVVGHELTHGVTERESSLFYVYESGAINESFSDVWGEYVDQINGAGTDTAAVKWLMGEDVPGFGAIRNMKNPPAFGDPDSMTSPKYYKGTGDNGGVHFNSGVNNKAVYLMVDGGSFGGKTVTALGWTKTLTVYYEAQTNLLVSGSGYYDLYYALYQACINKLGTNGLAMADCQEVRDATDAVKMNKEPAAGFNPNVDSCPAGMTSYQDVFTEDFESGTADWTFGGVKPAAWSLWSASPWYPYWGPNAADGTESLYADDDSGYFHDYTNNNAWAMSPSIVLPASSKPYLTFSHWFGFEYFNTSYYDGGVLEYSTDGGTTWLDAKPLFDAGQNYKGKVYAGNPLGVREAFVKESHGYADSRYKLSSLAGQTVRFRWRIGTDFTGAYWGWFIDDVQVNTCLTVPSTPALQSPANNSLVFDYTPALNWSNSTGDVWQYRYQVSSDPTFTVVDSQEGMVGMSEIDLLFALNPNTKYYWRVRAENQAGGASAWSATRSLRAAILPPNSIAPGAELPNPFEQIFTDRPTFTWDAVAGATNYTLQVSKVSTFGSMVLNKVVPGTSYTHTADLPVNTVFYWRVKANGLNGPSLYSDVRTFRTANPPSAPTLVSPANNALVSSSTPLLDWSNSAVPAGTTFLYYQVQVAFDSAFTAFIWDANVSAFNAAGSSANTPSLPTNTYYWRVRSWNTGADNIAGNADDEYSGWSAVRYFRAP